MTLTANSTEKVPVGSKPVAGVRQWQEEMDFLEREVKFYRQLLRLGIYQGSERSKPALFSLLNEFSGIEDELLPPMRVSLTSIAAGNDRSTEAEPSEKMAFGQELERLRKSLRKLKARFFPLAHELQAFSIF